MHIQLSMSLHFYLFSFKQLRQKRRILTSLYARETVQLIPQETLDFTFADLCPTNSPDLNLVDYRIWGLSRNTVHCTRHLSATSET